MALSANTLAQALKDMPEFNATEADGITAFADAWVMYWEESEAALAGVPPGVAANPAPAAARAAFEAALVGIGVHAANAVPAATKVINACAAFWTAASPTLAYPTVPPPAGAYVTPPPFMLALPASIAALAAAMQANIDSAKSRDDSLLAIATAIHSGQAGATFLDTTVPTPLTYVVL